VLSCFVIEQVLQTCALVDIGQVKRIFPLVVFVFCVLQEQEIGLELGQEIGLEDPVLSLDESRVGF
jgi:hypothetical protein